ncbi:uncharacterized protein LOC106013735, partial [Aplysia californica]|uniref:Uncharacterized protein LOC106013735 n=1 Tax=Aplysia californica TaxID=6500 RepID=A0ABM1ADQ7_APLCA
MSRELQNQLLESLRQENKGLRELLSVISRQFEEVSHAQKEGRQILDSLVGEKYVESLGFMTCEHWRDMLPAIACKVDGIRRCFRDGGSVESDFHYIEPFGYFVKAQVLFQGDSFNLFVIMDVGKFDDFLPWPAMVECVMKGVRPDGEEVEVGVRSGEYSRPTEEKGASVVAWNMTVGRQFLEEHQLIKHDSACFKWVLNVISRRGSRRVVAGTGVASGGQCAPNASSEAENYFQTEACTCKSPREIPTAPPPETPCRGYTQVVTGDLGNVAGDVTGGVVDNVEGHTADSVAGDVTGDTAGNVVDDTAGNMCARDDATAAAPGESLGDTEHVSEREESEEEGGAGHGGNDNAPNTGVGDGEVYVGGDGTEVVLAGTEDGEVYVGGDGTEIPVVMAGTEGGERTGHRQQRRKWTTLFRFLCVMLFCVSMCPGFTFVATARVCSYTAGVCRQVWDSQFILGTTFNNSSKANMCLWADEWKCLPEDETTGYGELLAWVQNPPRVWNTALLAWLQNYPLRFFLPLMANGVSANGVDGYVLENMGLMSTETSMAVHDFFLRLQRRGKELEEGKKGQTSSSQRKRHRQPQKQHNEGPEMSHHH